MKQRRSLLFQAVSQGAFFRSLLEELYGVEVSPTLISNVTDAVLDEVRAWQNRPLDAVIRSCTWTRYS